MKDSFAVKYAVNLWLTSMKVTGPLGALLSMIAVRILGDMLDRGFIKVDIAIDRLKEAMKDPQWRAAAEKAYKEATAKVYTEKEKDAIRKQYLDALNEYIGFNRMPNN